MRQVPPRSSAWVSLLAYGLLGFSSVALAQPADDPALAEPASPAKPATPPPATRPATSPSPSSTPRPSTVYVPPPAPAYERPRETVDTKVEWVDEKTAAAIPLTDLYDRVAAPSLGGPVGLFRTLTGDSGKQGTFRVGLHISGFKQSNFLISGNGSLKGDENSRFTGDLTIAYTPWKYLEAYLAIFNTSNENTRTDPGRTDPDVILALGDLALGIKGRLPVARFVDLGLHLGVRFNNSVSGISFDGKSTNFAVDAISSFDLRHAQATAHVPLRFHVNFGFLLDNSISLLPAGQCGLSTGNDPCIRSRVVESFAYGIGSERLRLALAADAPIVLPRNVGFEPFVEWHLDASVGDGDVTIRHALASSVSGDRLDGKVQQWLTLGIRIRPVAGLVLDTGLDVGLQSPGFAYGSPVPAWNLIFGAAYAYGGPSGGPGKTKVITKTVTLEVPRGEVTGRIRGIVRDAITRKPLGGATIRYANRRATPQITGEDGTFLSYAFTPGGVTIEVTREDYNPGKLESSVNPNGETAVELFLQPKPPSAGTLKARVTDPTGAPVNATVRVTATNGSVIDADNDGPGQFVARLPQGDYTMDVVANNYLAKQIPVLINSGQTATADVTLVKRPAVSHVSLGKGQINVKGVIHFGTNDAVIRIDSEQLLDEIADVIIRNPQLRKIRIEGHTDNRGVPEKNLALSKARAEAVRAHLVKQGVDPNRLEAEGYGATQPLVPNLTPANRARNRRVAFKIVDTGAAAKPGIPLE